MSDGIFREDQKVVQLWTEYGIPMDTSSVGYARDLIVRLWNRVEELDALIFELTHQEENRK